MHSRDLNRAVARATREAVREIAVRGFVLLTCGPIECELPDDANQYSLGESWNLEPGAPALVF